MKLINIHELLIVLKRNLKLSYAVEPSSPVQLCLATPATSSVLVDIKMLLPSVYNKNIDSICAPQNDPTNQHQRSRHTDAK